MDPCVEGNEALSLEEDPFDPASNNYDWISSSPPIPPFSNCADGSDNEGDGVSDEFDNDCFELIDIDGNGICDTRVYTPAGAETGSDPFFVAVTCTDFEGCLSNDDRIAYAEANGLIKEF